MSAIPEGFRELPGLSPFNALVGPLYERRVDENLSLGLRVEAKHTNSRGICHGGVLATLVRVSAIFARAGKEQ
jgi:acyl-coenzyme A thioesterase 13